MFLECKYNSRQLFSGHWDLCTAEEDVEESERVIFCPLTSGSKTYAVDRKIPGYLPTVSAYINHIINTRISIPTVSAYINHNINTRISTYNECIYKPYYKYSNSLSTCSAFVNKSYYKYPNSNCSECIYKSYYNYPNIYLQCVYI